MSEEREIEPRSPGPERRSWRSVLAWGLFGLSATALVVSFVLTILLGTWQPEDAQLVIPTVIGTFAMAFIGALIASRTGNAIGWIYLGIPSVLWVSQVAQDLSDYGIPRRAGYAEIAYWLSQWPFFLTLLLFVSVFYLFPTGHLSSPRWRWPWRVYLISAIVTVVGFALQPYVYRPEESAGSPVATNPFAVEALDPVLGPLLAVSAITLLVSGFVAFASLMVRYRGADVEERQQIRWLFAVGAFGAGSLILLLVFGPMSETVGAAQAIANILMVLLVALLAIGIPAATAVAVFRYHLYELNLVIRKTVVYAVLVGFVTVVYAGVVAGLSGLVGGDSLVLSILATGIVAGLFQPVRRWATRVANRLVFGRRAEPYEVLARFSDRVGETYADEDVLPRMARVIAEGTGAERVELWLAGVDDHVAAAWPSDAAPIGEADRVVEVLHQGRTLGEIRVRKPPDEPLSAPEEKLLQDLASQAGAVVRNVGMTSELQDSVDELSTRAEELRASRARIVAAHDAERRRLERNIHDGAQQHLVALAVKLRLAKSLAANGKTKDAERMLLDLRDQTELARTTLLDLASGIYPATLEERGIAAALEERARAAGAPVAVDANAVERLSIETEAAVYFVCLEAIQNAQKYARASHVDVRLGRDDGHLAFEIRDDGVGFDGSAAAGSGLQNMRDRLSALGGEVEIRSSPGAGTTVRGRVPLEREAVT